MIILWHPKHFGGPGNIIENLVPVGFSLNRYKSDSIPRSFLQVALENDFKDSLIGFQRDIIETLKDESQFIRKSKSPKSNDLARQINTKVCSWSDMKKISWLAGSYYSFSFSLKYGSGL